MSHAHPDPEIGYCPECGVVVSRHHADHPGLFHPAPSLRTGAQT